MNLQTLWAVALCEMRSCSRLARTWVVTVFAFLTATGGYIAVCASHMLASTLGPSAQIPRFVVGETATQFVGVFTLGIIFLAFDIRARDVRDRISGIIDAKPVSNLELVVGRLSGILILLCIPMLLFIGLVLLHGILADIFNWSFGAPIEIWSVISFLVWDVVPQLTWWGGIIMLLAVVLRNRLLVVLTALGLFVLNFWLAMQLSWGQMEIAGAVTSQVVYPSDVAPVFATASIITQRVAWMLISIGILGGAAALLPRQMSRRTLFGSASVLAFGLGVVTLIGLFSAQSQELKQKTAWLQDHQSQDTTAFPDVTSLTGDVIIKPGNRIELNLTLTLLPPQQNWTDQVTFTLNPRYKVKKVAIDTKEIEDYAFHDNGLLKVPAYHFGNESATLQIACEGKPDPKFAYLDAKIDLSTDSVFDFSVAMARFLGNKSYIFRPDYVALLPGVSWYPTAGVAIGQDNPQTYPKDHFLVDLSVTVPKKWTVAGPGKRELQTNNDGKNTFRFRPENPVVDVVLVASKFERFAMTVKDIEFELLYNAKHRKSFVAMESLVPELQNWIADRLTVAENYGLKYPYEALTLVEVPSHLRVLGGGWSMDSTLYGPGVVMIRETGIPTSRFDVKFKDQDGEKSFRNLLYYVDNDYQSGNLLNGIARNFVTYQTSPFGRSAIALRIFLEDIVGDLIVERLPYFTTNTALSPSGVTQIDVASQGSSTPVSIGVGSMILRNSNTHKTSIRSMIEENALSELNFHEDPIQSYHAVLFRNTYALAALKEWADEEVLGNILRDLLQTFRGQNFSFGEFREIAIEHEPRFDEITQNFMTSSELPGYIVSDVTIEKLATEDPSTQIFQTVFDLRNEGSGPGVVTVRWDEEQGFGSDGEEVSRNSLDPSLIEPNSSYRFAIKSSQKPTKLVIEAPMSLNREPIELTIPSIDDTEIDTASSRPTSMRIQWNPGRTDQIVVDDLDQGFSVSGEPQEWPIPWFIPNFLVEMGRPFMEDFEEIDRGLPVYNQRNPSEQWTRFQGSGFGRYRNTFTRVQSVQEDDPDASAFSAEFVVELPNSGEWALEYSVPSRILLEQILQERDPDEQNSDTGDGEGSDSQDNLTLALVVQFDDQEIPFNLDLFTLRNEFRFGDQHLIEGSATPCFWAALGSYNIKEPRVSVKVSNKSSIRDTFADAVRWTFLGDGNSDE
ncbi:MAG: hypothetical protein F4227_05540 [Gammaproteobacteria bacterium]|nr:hypothetical protein [Gammaproteobacteria bacterium]MYF02431.1 hypothetical protein [Gammaproteobacteria bacterium]MYI78033.1 hypothetical protein [Gammaproteobacteria bacterium]